MEEKRMKTILLYIWQLPQHLLGLLLIKVLKAERHYYIRRYYLFERNNRFSRFISGISLGNYILLSSNNDDENTIKHENGHSIQSLYLGPLYLLVIGLPSMLFNNLWDMIFHTRWSFASRNEWYYNRYPEKWADKLGGVKRQ
jgi:hypothetical protein